MKGHTAATTAVVYASVGTQTLTVDVPTLVSLAVPVSLSVTTPTSSQSPSPSRPNRKQREARRVLTDDNGDNKDDEHQNHNEDDMKTSGPTGSDHARASSASTRTPPRSHPSTRPVSSTPLMSRTSTPLLSSAVRVRSRSQQRLMMLPLLSVDRDWGVVTAIEVFGDRVYVGTERGVLASYLMLTKPGQTAADIMDPDDREPCDIDLEESSGASSPSSSSTGDSACFKVELLASVLIGSHHRWSMSKGARLRMSLTEKLPDRLRNLVGADGATENDLHLADGPAVQRVVVLPVPGVVLVQANDCLALYDLNTLQFLEVIETPKSYGSWRVDTFAYTVNNDGSGQVDARVLMLCVCVKQRMFILRRPVRKLQDEWKVVCEMFVPESVRTVEFVSPLIVCVGFRRDTSLHNVQSGEVVDLPYFEELRFIERVTPSLLFMSTRQSGEFVDVETLLRASRNGASIVVTGTPNRRSTAGGLRSSLLARFNDNAKNIISTEDMFKYHPLGSGARLTFADGDSPMAVAAFRGSSGQFVAVSFRSRVDVHSIVGDDPRWPQLSHVQSILVDSSSSSSSAAAAAAAADGRSPRGNGDSDGDDNGRARRAASTLISGRRHTLVVQGDYQVNLLQPIDLKHQMEDEMWAATVVSMVPTVAEVEQACLDHQRELDGRHAEDEAAAMLHALDAAGFTAGFTADSSSSAGSNNDTDDEQDDGAGAGAGASSSSSKGRRRSTSSSRSRTKDRHRRRRRRRNRHRSSRRDTNDHDHDDRGADEDGSGGGGGGGGSNSGGGGGGGDKDDDNNNDAANVSGRADGQKSGDKLNSSLDVRLGRRAAAKVVGLVDPYLSIVLNSSSHPLGQMLTGFAQHVSVVCERVLMATDNVKYSTHVDEIALDVQVFALRLQTSCKFLWPFFERFENLQELLQDQVEKFLFARVHRATFPLFVAANKQEDERLAAAYTRLDRSGVVTLEMFGCYLADGKDAAHAGTPDHVEQELDFELELDLEPEQKREQQERQKQQLKERSTDQAALFRIVYKQLRHIVRLSTPTRKLSTIRETHDLVHNVCAALWSRTRPGERFIMAADDLMPVLCFVLALARVPHLHAELQFVHSFLPESETLGQGGYMITSLQIAAYSLPPVANGLMAVQQQQQQQQQQQVGLSSPAHGTRDHRARSFSSMSAMSVGSTSFLGASSPVSFAKQQQQQQPHQHIMLLSRRVIVSPGGTHTTRATSPVLTWQEPVNMVFDEHDALFNVYDEQQEEEDPEQPMASVDDDADGQRWHPAAPPQLVGTRMLEPLDIQEDHFSPPAAPNM